ncbi:MAG: endonuclease III domain-containing protein [Candidatus Omnitrophota bacterium]|nr:endonuclease III domain-containing protein [Candidatus Omnitrophota bacterium]MDZ4242466.1 endonuclease III domain-containing protein [Candidatus Omnitrophota bacterium]
MPPSRRNILLRIYRSLSKAFGPQHWWPGETPFEVIVGAILTQNTNWRNVEKAIANLKEARLMSPAGLRSVSSARLSRLIRPSGYFNIKAGRLKNFIRLLFSEYDGRLDEMGREPLDALRKKLLEVKGIGPETADSILLYAFGKPVFVVDAYTKRVFFRHRIIGAGTEYHGVQKIFREGLPEDAALFNEYHALIVRLGKDHCRTRPRCAECPLNGLNKDRRYAYRGAKD